MNEQAEYSARGSSQDVLERLDRLEAAVKRVLSLQRIDDFTTEAGLFKSTQSIGCSSASTGGCCTQSNAQLATPRGSAG